MRKVALVTAHRPVRSRALVVALARAGYQVALHPPGPAAWVREARRAVERIGGAPLRLVGATGNGDGPVNRALIAPGEHLGRLDVLVWGAGVGAGEELRGPIPTLVGALPPLAASGGALVPVLDAVPEVPVRDAFARMVGGLARTLAPGVRVNGVAPGGEAPASARGRRAATLHGPPPRGEADVARAVLFILGAPWLNGEVVSA
ncbi:MAG: hypothetical protein RQ751_01190 [Longimicrobiales bacterium]|nr:hypothetical protein [Longimicrobiales bacterium]